MSDDTKTSNPLARDYLGHKIEFSPSDLKFHISGPEFDQYKAEFCTCGSFDEARTKVDAEVNDANKFRAQNIKFRETVIDRTGEHHLILGINRTTGRIVGPVGDYVYPNVKWIVDDLKRLQQIRLELNVIENRTSTFKIPISRGYGRISAVDYIGHVELLSSTITKKTELANQSIPATAEVIDLKKSS